LVHVGVECLEAGVRGRPATRGITAITELALIAQAAPGAGDPQHLSALSVEVREGTDAALIDRATAGKAAEIEVRRRRMRRAFGNQRGRREPAGGDGLEAAIAPAPVEDQAVDGGLRDDR